MESELPWYADPPRVLLWAFALLVVLGSMALGLGDRLALPIALTALIVCALGAALTTRHGWWRPLWLAAIQVSYALLVVVYLGVGPERHELRSEGDALVECIERYTTREGRVPATLEAAGCTARWNRWGGWQYSVRESGSSWMLWVGEYEVDRFTLALHSGATDWYMDD